MNEQQILEEALKLPEEARRRLAEALEGSCENLNPKLKTALVDLAKARLEDYKAGRSKTYTPEEFMTRARERFNARVNKTADH